MEESSSNKPLVVTSSLNFKVTTPSFYNQPKKFASVAPPRPKSQTPPSAPSPTPLGTAVIGRVGDLPPPPSSLCDDFPPPPPPPPPMDDDLPAPPSECQITPAFPAPPPVADDLPLPAPPEEIACPPTCPSPPPPPPPPPLPASGSVVQSGRQMEKQTSFDKQLDSLTDLLSEMETKGPFNPKLPSQYSSAPAPKFPAPPPTAPKPALSFLPPPEMGDRPPPAPWAEELKARTNRQSNHNSAPNAGAQGFAKAAEVSPKPSFGGKVATSSASLPSPPAANRSFPTPPAAPPAAPAPVNHKSGAAAAPTAANNIKSSPFGSKVNANQKTPAAPSPPNPVPVQGGQGRGKPLNMREVEELEQMAQDFIKNMDTQPPIIAAPPAEVCGRCGEALSHSQPAVKAMDKLFHSNCFSCMSCQRPLQGMQFYDRNGSPQCEDCYKVRGHQFSHKKSFIISKS
uniref:Zyxin n=1 Tax=Oryzias sinensis TaxID=183150 RepID=A0A8C7YZE4_9TELE